jgi:protein-tyrosine-phosphatase
MKIILFVCKGNSGRSQMAEAFLNHFCKSVKALSAGVEPDEKIHPWTIQVMQEVGIDVSQHKPKPLTEEMMEKADKIILMDSDLLKEIPKISIKSRKLGYRKTIREIYRRSQKN